MQKGSEFREFLQAVSGVISKEAGELLTPDTLRRIEGQVLSLARGLSRPPRSVRVSVDWPTGSIVISFDEAFESFIREALGLEKQPEPPEPPVGAVLHAWSTVDGANALEIRKTETGFELVDETEAVLWSGDNEQEGVEAAQLCILTDGAVAN